MPPKAEASKAPPPEASALQKQLLELVQSRGNARAATDAFLRLAAVNMDDVLVDRPESATKATTRRLASERDHGSVVDALLNQYSVSSDYWRLRESAEGQKHARAVATKGAKKSKEAAPDTRRQWALVAAKVAQSVVKTYASNASDDEACVEDLKCAVDLAVMALRVVFRHSNAARLGDFVAENLLYQVTKKATEIPKLSTIRVKELNAQIEESAG
ncbi:hypothetical protein ATCC90586_000694 [Pythium insidiosum]|nr:hypothetical protein ATCC90586_000694 [Pythium insidiosum]